MSHENTNRIIKKKSAYSVDVYGALDVRLFPNKRLNVDLKNIEIWVSHGLNFAILLFMINFIRQFFPDDRHSFIIYPAPKSSECII